MLSSHILQRPREVEPQEAIKISIMKSTNILSSDIDALCNLSTAGTGLDTVGENNRLAASG
jgi:hypothetical protein